MAAAFEDKNCICLVYLQHNAMMGLFLGLLSLLSRGQLEIPCILALGLSSILHFPSGELRTEEQQHY